MLTNCNNTTFVKLLLSAPTSSRLAATYSRTTVIVEVSRRRGKTMNSFSDLSPLTYADVLFLCREVKLAVIIMKFKGVWFSLRLNFSKNFISLVKTNIFTYISTC